jgi:uncharacterized Zn finger protein
MIKNCPYCSDNRFFVNGVIKGSVAAYYNESGMYEEIDLDKCYWESQSNVARCENCGKIRKDVSFDRQCIKEL